ncbi:Uncharacterized protein HZ326_15913 [Fusarium oxysporum f. sp. albedinis]|nr:Uncharacterized protein HZ326_15913 [Fusarium oxysporum f. sp. albedinis]
MKADPLRYILLKNMKWELGHAGKSRGHPTATSESSSMTTNRSEFHRVVGCNDSGCPVYSAGRVASPNRSAFP